MVSNFDLRDTRYGVRENSDVTNTTDISASLQLAIDDASQVIAAGRGRGSGAVVRIPAGVYELSHPLRVSSSHISILGASQRATRLNVTMAGGDVFAVGSPLQVFQNDQPVASFPMVETTGHRLTQDEKWALNLFHGTGHGFVPYWLNATHSGLYFDDWKELSLEFFLLFSELPDQTGTLIRCAGMRFWSEPISETLSIGIDPSGFLIVLIRIGDATYTLKTLNALSVKINYHIAIDYDGDTVRLFIEGQLHDKAAATGTLKQQPYEDCTIGTSFNEWPEGHIATNPPYWKTSGKIHVCALSGIRFGSLSKYHTPFIPPTVSQPPGAGGEWTLQLNSHNLPDIHANSEFFKIGLRNNKTGYAWVRHLDKTRGGNGISLQSLFIFCGALGRNGRVMTAISGQHAVGLNCKDIHSVGMSAINLSNNCFLSTLTGISSSGGTDVPRPGIMITNASGVTTLEDFKISGGIYPLTIRNSGVSVRHGYITGQEPHAYMLLLNTADVNFEGLFISDENEFISTEAGVLFEGGHLGFARIRGLIEVSNQNAGPRPPFKVYPPVPNAGTPIGTLFFEGTLALHPNQAYCFKIVDKSITPTFKTFVHQRGLNKELSNVIGHVVSI